jgi:acetylornithine deacetylase/succinyl-diaminopimelate desuccinylase-like protein
VHSGGASGHVPSSFRIARHLLSRIEDEETGEIKVKELHTNIPEHRKLETEDFVNILGEEVVDEFPWKGSTKPSTSSLVEGVLRRTWRPALSVVGANGLPPSENAGNVLRPYTELQLSLRIPPMVDPILARNAVLKTLSENTPYDAAVVVKCEEAAAGWSAPKTSRWLSNAIKKASLEFFKESDCSMSEGGTIPFMAMLGEKYPRAQFIITGVLGPGSNAHGPNEFLHIPYAKKLTCCIASIINDFN